VRAAGIDRLPGTIAHELGHGTNLWHHGDTDYKVKEVRYFGTDGAWHDSLAYAGVGWRVAGQRGQLSGMQDCIMRYVASNFYEVAGGRWSFVVDEPKVPAVRKQGEEYPLAVPQPRIMFCPSPDGTGINAKDRPGGSVAGDATRGRCQDQFQLNDMKATGAK
jgi:hypothetical protein